MSDVFCCFGDPPGAKTSFPPCAMWMWRLRGGSYCVCVGVLGVCVFICVSILVLHEEDLNVMNSWSLLWVILDDVRNPVDGLPALVVLFLYLSKHAVAAVRVVQVHVVAQVDEKLTVPTIGNVPVRDRCGASLISHSLVRR